MKPLLELRGVGKTFGGLRAVHDLSMKVEQGDFAGVIGPNGAGKTTMMNLITGYLRPSAGDILLEGVSVAGERPYRLCHLGIGRTFQVVQPFVEMTVEDNVVTGALFSAGVRPDLSAARRAAEKPLRLTGLFDKRHFLAGALTLGEKKKLELARALATNPKLLLLDEVMGGVSRHDIEDLLVVLRRIHQDGVTIVMIEHLVEVILALARHVVVLNFGEKLFEGTPRDVIEHPAVIESYLGRPLEVEGA